MASIFGKGGPAVITYEDDENKRIRRISVPLLQNIQFDQTVQVPSRPTIEGDFRNQVTRRSAPSISFDILLSDRVTADLDERFLYTTEAFIKKLQDIKLNGYPITLSTNSPLDRQLNNLIISKISYTHDAKSREIVSCNISCTRAKFVKTEYRIASKAEILGLTVTTADPGAPEIETIGLGNVYSDGAGKFLPTGRWSDNFFQVGDTLEQAVGKYAVRKLKGTEQILAKDWLGSYLAPDFYMANTPINMNANNKIYQYNIYVDSIYGLPGQAQTEDGKLQSYRMHLVDIQVQSHFTDQAVLKPPVYYPGFRDTPSITARSGGYTQFAHQGYMNNIITTYDIGFSTSAYKFIDNIKFDKVMKAKLAKDKTVVTPTNAVMNTDTSYKDGQVEFQSNNNIIVDDFGDIWAKRLSDQHDISVSWKNPNETKYKDLLVEQDVSGGFDIYHWALDIEPQFDPVLSTKTVSIDGKSRDYETLVRERRFKDDDNKCTTMHIFLWTNGDQLAFIIMDTNTFGSDKDNDQRVIIQ